MFWLTLCNDGDHNCKLMRSYDDTKVTVEVAQFTVGGGQWESHSHNLQAQHEKERHSHILEANGTCEPAYFLYFISTNCMLRRALWHECPPPPPASWESWRSLCRWKTGVSRRDSSVPSLQLFLYEMQNVLVFVVLFQRKMICSIMTSRCFLPASRILVFPDPSLMHPPQPSFSTPLSWSRQRNISN